MARFEFARFTATPVVTAAVPPSTRTLRGRITARRLRKQNEQAGDCELIVVCPQCGERFSIAHEVPCANLDLAEKHTAWLLDRFVWDHIQENKHRGSILLPAAEELAQWMRSNHER